jgi:putative transposase
MSHTRWECKYHLVFIPKRRKKKVFGILRRYLGELFHKLASHGKAKIVEGRLMGDQVHLCIGIPPE